MFNTSKNTQSKGKGTTRPSQPQQAPTISPSSSDQPSEHQGTGQDPNMWNLPPSPPRRVAPEMGREGTEGGRGQGGRKGSSRGLSQSVAPHSSSHRQTSKTSSQPLEWTLLPPPPSLITQHSSWDTSGQPDWT
ncbi:hypothetical protein AcW1_007345 [Taiwanofungus camphoratus]|nr:hypothetical protein AcV5_007944 [Antrodia cinnamomea]KAI0953020.1 hypothetical protein AcW1_007345 [Antrodia cinnamomea]